LESNKPEVIPSELNERAAVNGCYFWAGSLLAASFCVMENTALSSKSFE
jgi:hypothetical protein